MALRAVEHIFNGSTTPITSYDSTKTNLGTLMIQKSGTAPEDNYVGPLPVAIARPMEESTAVAPIFPHVITFSSTIDWVFVMENATATTRRIFLYEYNKSLATYNWKGFITMTTPNAGTTANRGFRALRYLHTTGTVAVAAPVSSFSTGTVTVSTGGLVTHSATGFLATMVGKMIGFGSTNVAQINCWYPIVSFATTSTMNILGASSAYAAGTSFVIADCTVTGTGTFFKTEGVAAGTGATAVTGGLGPRIGFGSTDPTQITQWYHIGLTTSDTSIGLTTSPGVIPAGTPYVIEELRFAITITNSTTAANGGLFLLKGAGYHNFTTAGSTFPAIATSVDDQRGVYWLCDAGTTGNVLTNQSAAGLTILPETNKGLHYAYVLDGSTTTARMFRYNLRATGTITSGKMLMTIAYTTSTSSSTTVTVSGTTVTNSGTAFTSAMVGMKIAFGTAGIANVTTWYTIASFTSTSVVVLSSSAGSLGSGLAFIIDSADVISTSPQLVTGNLSLLNNGRYGTLNHGPGAGEPSIYFVTASRIYRAAVAKIFDGNLGWISDNRPEIPPGSVSTFPATGALSMVEIADAMDRLIILSTGASGTRHYVTRYPQAAGDQFDHIWGVDDKQQDQASSLGNAYVSSGTVAVSSTAVTGTNTFFVAAMVGYRIGFGSTDPTAIVTWYTISAFTSITSITLSSSAGTIGAGSAYVIDWNSNTVPHFNSASQATSIWSENGIAHIVKHGTTTALSQMYAIPFSAHWTYASSTNQRLISPTLYTPDCVQFRSIAVTHDDSLGSGEFSISTEPFRMYFRTNGIDTNTGEWTLIDADGDLRGITSAPYIQIMFEFAVISISCIPARILGFTIIYDDTATTTDSHYQPSAGLSSGASKQFTWRFSVAFGGTVPTLRVRLYNALTNNLLVDDYTTSTNSGTWEKSTNSGGTWGAYNTTDKGNETTYIRYTPASLGDNIKVRAVLTQ